MAESKYDEPKNPRHYFDNKKVEQLIKEYQARGCTDVNLRDELMSHANDLILNVIRTHNLHNIYGGKDDSSFNDLFQIGWQQIESTLYKFKVGPKTPKIFNMWSQVARTVMLATIKKNNRDKKNAESYRYYLDGRAISRSVEFDRFIKEARDLYQYCDVYIHLLDCLEALYMEDERPHEGLISKMVDRSNESRSCISRFLRLLRLLCGELSDGPIDDDDEQIIKPSMMLWIKDDEE